MSDALPGIGSRSLTYAEPETEERSKTISYVLTQSAAVAAYVHDDLARLVDAWKIDLAALLRMPRDHVFSNDQLIALLCEDIAHMLRNALVSRVRFLLHEHEPTADTGVFPLLYMATYEISVERGLRPVRAQRVNGLIDPPNLPRGDFAILIDWHPNASPAQRDRVRYPTYQFDWRPTGGTYDATTLVRYREGSLTADGATIIARRDERTVAAGLK